MSERRPIGVETQYTASEVRRFPACQHVQFVFEQAWPQEIVGPRIVPLPLPLNCPAAVVSYLNPLIARARMVVATEFDFVWWGMSCRRKLLMRTSSPAWCSRDWQGSGTPRTRRTRCTAG